MITDIDALVLELTGVFLDATDDLPEDTECGIRAVLQYLSSLERLR